MTRLGVLLLLGGCTFGIDGLPITSDDMTVVLPDGGGGDGSGGGGRDLSGVDLLGHVPDGATLGGIGWPCNAASDCDNGLCIDGYCCDDLCDPNIAGNGCKACNVPGAEGRCVLALDGTDPRGFCTQDPPNSCGHDGLCDGMGSCRLYAAGSACGAAKCSNGVATYVSACDGAGSCMQAPMESCYPYDCADAMNCATSCTQSSGCATGVSCDSNGSCGGKANGQPCGGAGECGSGFCVQGVCCASDCSGTCFACNLPGTTGTCAPVPNGMDPLAQCTATPQSGCGTDGQCDGSGACRNWPAGTVCVQAECFKNSVTDPRLCDGKGTCAPPKLHDCAPYTCDVTTVSCFQSCVGPMQCAAGVMCHKGACK
jgi:hypothetical protein